MLLIAKTPKFMERKRLVSITGNESYHTTHNEGVRVNSPIEIIQTIYENARFLKYFKIQPFFRIIKFKC